MSLARFAALLLVVAPPASAQTAQYRAILDSSFAAPDLELSWLQTLQVDRRLRVYVPDETTPILYRLSPDGRTAEQLVRHGEGPGEAKSIRSLGWFGDTLWLSDNRLSRTTFLAPDDAVARTEGIRERCTRSSATILIAGGCLEFANPRPYNAKANDPTPPAAVLVTSGRGAKADTIGSLTYTHLSMQFDRPDAMAVVPQQFPDDPVYFADRSGTSVLRILRGAASSSRLDSTVIERWSAGKGWHQRQRISYRPRALEGRVFDSTLAVLGGRLARGRHWVTLDSVKRKSYHPPFYPPVPDAISMSDGTVWLHIVEETGPGSGTSAQWLILDLNLRPIRKVTAPLELRVLDARDTLVWGAITDQDDVPHVVRYRLVPE